MRATTFHDALVPYDARKPCMMKATVYNCVPKSLYELRRVVSGAVVNYQHFKWRASLSQGALNGALDPVGRIKRWNDYG